MYGLGHLYWLTCGNYYGKITEKLKIDSIKIKWELTGI